MQEPDSAPGVEAFSSHAHTTQPESSPKSPILLGKDLGVGKRRNGLPDVFGRKPLADAPQQAPPAATALAVQVPLLSPRLLRATASRDGEAESPSSPRAVAELRTAALMGRGYSAGAAARMQQSVHQAEQMFDGLDLDQNGMMNIEELARAAWTSVVSIRLRRLCLRASCSLLTRRVAWRVA